jgi:hypothetical protein
MAKRTLRVSTKAARLALRRLIVQLGKADLSGLADRVRKKGKAKTAREWVSILRAAEREIPEWCPNDTFTIDLPPARARARGRARGRRRT